MALTAEQEARLIQIIEAFNNAKRLNELPLAGGTNPFDLVVEVLDTDGESKQAKLAAMLPYLEEQCAYGIEWDTEVSSPLCTRIGNLSLHRKLPIQNRMRGCLLDDNGKVVEYLHPTNWLTHDRSGARGQVMVEIPAHFRKFEHEGTKRRAFISEFPLPGYHCVKQKYISAYEAALERSTGKLCSVVNTGADYRGGNNEAALDGTYQSLLGRPAATKTRTEFRTAARSRAEGTKWNCLDYNLYKDVAWLYYIEYANRNSQDAFNAQKDANGYAQGGLGKGVTTLSVAEWTEYNQQRVFVPCGHSDSLGNASGEVNYYMLKEDGSLFKTLQVPRYRGIENLFGHLYKWVDGINIEVKTDADGGTSKVYVCNDPKNYNDSNYNRYEMRGLAARGSGYIREIIMGDYGDIIPSLTGAGSTTYWCDMYYSEIRSNNLFSMVSGGVSYYDGSAGIGCTGLYIAPSTASSLFGARLCFIPEN